MKIFKPKCPKCKSKATKILGRPYSDFDQILKVDRMCIKCDYIWLEKLSRCNHSQGGSL